MTFSPEQFRADFPILQQTVHGKPLVYLDNAASTQKPLCVINRIADYYKHEHANVHRGIHHLSQIATDAYEGARRIVQRFINADSADEIIFVRGTTEAINLMAHSFGSQLEAGDEILITAMEHHSNIVPWQMLAERQNIKLRVIPMTETGELILENIDSLLNERTKLLSIVHVSNAIGTINPVEELIQLAHEKNIPVLLDGAQAVAHTPIDVQKLDCDFYAFSGHKVFGPTGIGVLYGKRHHLEAIPPFQGGGDMIRSVSFEKSEYNLIPNKFEAGTPHIAGAIGLGTALEYLMAIGVENIQRYENELLAYAQARVAEVPGVRLIGTAKHKASVISFIFEDIHAHDVGTILDQQGIAIRSGHHCAMPLMDFFQIPASARASLAFYNTKEEVDQLVSALHQVCEVFA